MGGRPPSIAPFSRERSEAIFDAASDSGVGFIDTAAAYGLGAAEVLIGTWRDSLESAVCPQLITKVGLSWEIEEGGGVTVSRSLEPSSIDKSLNGSLMRIGVDVLDVVLVHWPDGKTPLEVYWPHMIGLREQGVVRRVGLSNHTLEQQRACERIGHIDVHQFDISAPSRDAIIEFSERNGTTVMLYGALAGGAPKSSVASRTPPLDTSIRSAVESALSLSDDVILVAGCSSPEQVRDLSSIVRKFETRKVS